jgi:hypothetical protein
VLVLAGLAGESWGGRVCHGTWGVLLCVFDEAGRYGLVWRES